MKAFFLGICAFFLLLLLLIGFAITTTGDGGTSGKPKDFDSVKHCAEQMQLPALKRRV
ncbi:hypothetical protein [Pedobacter borealis]|uniref:hypothetical protein n=1 Tax=Pedobacter borealis TaxID=475254 RepID=UPI0012FB3063|nr:hypothetical protein [Pedobacter borealis]